MTKYLEKSFSVSVGGDAYSDGWERIWGKKKSAKKEDEEVEEDKDTSSEDDSESTSS